MILLDTDHLPVLKYRDGDLARQFNARLVSATDQGEQIGTTVITLEEQLRGWLSSLAKERQIIRQVTSYRELMDVVEFFRGFHLVPFDPMAAQQFENWGRIRIGTSDKKIAAIAVIQNALLLTANRRDFEQVPGLRFENWLKA